MSIISKQSSARILIEEKSLSALNAEPSRILELCGSLAHLATLRLSYVVT